MIQLRRLLPLILLVLCALPAHAADVVYPTGSRIGLVPPAGMEISTNFFGFEDRSNNAGIIIVTAPTEAYEELERTITSEALKKQGITMEAREGVTLSDGKGFLVVGRQVENARVRKWLLFAALPGLTALVTAQVPDDAKAAYTNSKIGDALRTVTARASIPTDEQLALLPFKVGDLAGFRVGGVIPGRALMLTDAKPDAPPTGADPHILIALGASGAVATADRDQFAREMLLGVPDLRGTRVTGSEPLRFGGQQGHQIFASARDAAGNELSVVQWVRFGGAGYMQLLGIARVDAWREAYPRFRAVRDGLER